MATKPTINDPQELGSTSNDIVANNDLFDDIYGHYESSGDFKSDYEESFDEKEAILTGSLQDELSTNVAKSQVYDPRLGTIVFERAARVMGQPAEGHAYAISKNDIGKNMLMDLTLKKYVYPNANYQMDFLIKDRLWDIYSNVYGVMFKMVGWVDDEKRQYFGPNDWLLPIRNCYPEPGKHTVNDSNWFGVLTNQTLEWIQKRPQDGTWKNLDEIISHLKAGKGKSAEMRDDSQRSQREKDLFPHVPVDPVYPTADFYTEYRLDRWITIAPDYGVVVREIKNPHNNFKLPIIPKYAFPLMDSIYGLGEVERGKTLQYAINSLINLYLDGVKMSLFPPIQINPNAPGLVPSSIRFDAAAKWLVGRPNIDIQQMQLSPKGMNTFQSTYSFLIAALLNQAGTTDTTVGSGTDPGMGKTPEAIKQLMNRESSRDNWDRFMLERAITDRNKQFIELIVEKMAKPIYVRLFEKEMQEIGSRYPDITELYESGRGSVRVDKSAIKAKYDYEVIPMSTVKKEPGDELKSLSQMMQMITRTPQILDVILQQNKQFGRPLKTLDLQEMFTRWMELTQMQDTDRYFGLVKPPSPDEMLDSSGLEDPQLLQAAKDMKDQLGGTSNIPIYGQ